MPSEDARERRASRREGGETPPEEIAGDDAPPGLCQYGKMMAHRALILVSEEP